MYEFLNRKGKGNFRTDDWYWSSSEHDSSEHEGYPSTAWNFYFEDGEAYYSYTIGNNGGYSMCYVCAVRTLP